MILQWSDSTYVGLLVFLHSNSGSPIWQASVNLKKYSQPENWELCFIWWELLGLQEQETEETEKMKKEYDQKIRNLGSLNTDEHVEFLSNELSKED